MGRVEVQEVVRVEGFSVFWDIELDGRDFNEKLLGKYLKIVFLS